MLNSSLFPTFLELLVECTYPTDQATSSALIYLSASIQGVLMMSTENFLYSPLSDEEMDQQTCSDKQDWSHETARNYTPYLIFITTCITVFTVLYCLFFNPEMRRSKADNHILQKKEELIERDSSTFRNESEETNDKEPFNEGIEKEETGKSSSNLC